MTSTEPVAAVTIAEAASRLLRAQATRTPCTPVRDLIGASNLTAAYAVQARLTRARLEGGASVVGRKIGLTSTAVQEQLGVDRPDFGVLFDDMDVSHDAEVSVDRLLQPRVEAEIAFVLGSDLMEEPLDLAHVRAAVDHMAVALEIVDSRIAGWDITFGDTVADNASSGLFLLGAQRRTLEDVEPRDVTMSMTRHGEVVSTGNGTACLGDPLLALAWLATTARDLGQPLLAGQVVLSGALGPMVPVATGDTFTAVVPGLGEVTARFATPDRDNGHDHEVTA